MRDELFQLHGQLEDSHWWFTARRSILVDLGRQLLANAVRPHAVDIGCGTGGNLAAFSHFCAGTGIDPSPAAVEIAKKRFPDLTFIAGEIAEVGESAVRSADIVLLTDVLEHVEDDFELLSSVLSLMTPGAHVLITVPANPGLWSRHDETFGHFRRYTKERLSSLWSGFPVNLRLLSHYNARLYPLIRAVRTLGRRFGSTFGRGGTDLRLPPAPVNRLLHRTFAGESERLVNRLDTALPNGYRVGVSLIAVLERQDGPIEARARPTDVPADSHFRRMESR